MNIDSVCDLGDFRRFMIFSTCQSYIPVELDEDDTVYPERSSDKGTMYVEAEDKVTVHQIREIRFARVSNVLGIIYNSKSGRTQLKWRHLKGRIGRLSGEASPNTLVNLFASRALPESYAINDRRKEPPEAVPVEQPEADSEGEEDSEVEEDNQIDEAFADT